MSRFLCEIRITNRSEASGAKNYRSNENHIRSRRLGNSQPSNTGLAFKITGRKSALRLRGANL